MAVAFLNPGKRQKKYIIRQNLIDGRVPVSGGHLIVMIKFVKMRVQI